MPGQDAIVLEGEIVEVLRPGLFRATLGNGHHVVAHPTRHSRGLVAGLRIGSKVSLEFSPFDMSTGRILAQAGPKDEQR